MIRFVIVLATMALASGAGAQEKRPAAQPLRGATPIPETSDSGIYKMERHDRVIPRSHAWQPPIIPHNVKGYQITKNVNTCMVCHAAKSAPRTGATPVGKSHYLDRDGKELEMPTKFDDFTEAAAIDAPCSPLAAENRQLLRSLMEKHGFRVLPTEWWHYDAVGWEKYPVLDATLEELAAKTEAAK